ncbi:hypothetical protein BUALT_Bualt08G0007900 [Buddleja alternifolia]|uniref:Uncharacterized protein n=1 Tax=Buddleja alternifolia TaxID=168488 RepID=A0AAV6XA39_9LAMI|nr:hypothetical protein BUALT_Bualt08G0007900 [Buddleja alternifolia]
MVRTRGRGGTKPPGRRAHTDETHGRGNNDFPVDHEEEMQEELSVGVGVGADAPLRSRTPTGTIRGRRSISRGRGRRHTPSRLQEHIEPLGRDGQSSGWEEELPEQTNNVDPPSRSSVGHPSQTRRRGPNRGTPHPIEPGLKIPIHVAGCRWEDGATGEIFDLWWEIADRRLRDMLCKERSKVASNVKSSNPLDWRVDGSISTHTGGSKPFAVHEQEMEAEYKRKVSKVELYDRTHRRNQGKGDFACPKAKRVRGTYDSLVGNDSQNSSSPPIFDPAAWIEATGAVPKGRVYGFGSQPPHQILGDIAHQGGSKSKLREASSR